MSSVISISLVLLLVGVSCMLLLNAGSVSNFFKENMEVSVIMKPHVSEEEALAFQGDLKDEGFVKTVTFISREQGEQELKEMLGEDFLDVFEASPVPISLNMTLDADYVTTDSLDVVKAKLLANDLVEEVNYQKSLIDALDSNFSKISLVLAVFIGLLLFVSYVLINNTVRLSVFARRFTIHTMKLVGATRSFIRAPFLWRAALQGLISAIVANSALWGIVMLMESRFGYVMGLLSTNMLVTVMAIVLVSGLLICVISTYFVVNKLISLKKDQLYY
jgi:cell division transport system permease protein